MATQTLLVSEAEIINATKQIISEYGGTRLTIRQIYYRLFSMGLIVNSSSAYKRIVAILGKARKNGLIRYTDIEDRTRTVALAPSQELVPAGYYFKDWMQHVMRIERNYTLPYWWGQRKQVIVSMEKQALSALFQQVLFPIGVDLVVCRGYPSLTQMYELAERMKKKEPEVQEIIMVYYGDFDPSGKDIERHVKKTLRKQFGIKFSSVRGAITKEQIEQYNIAPAPAKKSDSRYDSFVAREGVAWQVELDAIEPNVLKALIKKQVMSYFDNNISSSKMDELIKRRNMLKEWKEAFLDMEYEFPAITAGGDSAMDILGYAKSVQTTTTDDDGWGKDSGKNDDDEEDDEEDDEDDEEDDEE